VGFDYICCVEVAIPLDQVEGSTPYQLKPSDAAACLSIAAHFDLSVATTMSTTQQCAKLIMA